MWGKKKRTFRLFSEGIDKPAIHKKGGPPLRTMGSWQIVTLSNRWESKCPGFNLYCFYFLALWATRQTENTEENRELFIKTTLRELIVYAVFLTTLCVGSYSSHSSHSSPRLFLATGLSLATLDFYVCTPTLIVFVFA